MRNTLGNFIEGIDIFYKPELKLNKGTALFPGKFQPPHTGHILAIMNVIHDYDKLIISILDNEKTRKYPIKPKTIINIFKKIFPDYNIDYNIHKESLMKKANSYELPSCDVIITSNTEAYKNLKRMGYKVRKTKRVPIYRGELIRKAYLKGMANEKK